MKFATGFLIIIFSMGLHAETGVKATPKVPDKEAKAKAEKDKKVPLVDSDLSKLQKEIITTPKFSTESQDQEKIDQELQKNSELLHKSTVKRIIDSKNCGKLGSREAILACQKNVQGQSNQ